MSTYWQHYGMKSEPFVEDSASASSYMPLQWEQQMGLLQHLSWHSQVVLLVTGLSGIGKTTLLNQFVQAVTDKYHVLKLQGNESLGPDQLLKLLAERLGLGATQPMGATLQEQVISQLAVMQSSKQVLLLVVDDAHHLPSVTLNLILHLASPKAQVPTALHGVLFGGPQLEANMADITSQHLDEDLTHTLRIEPLNLEATDKYLQHGLHRAGYSQGALLFDETEIVDIYHASGGIPANINRLAQQALREKVPTAEREKGSALWSLPWVKAVGAVGIFVLLSWVMYAFMAQGTHSGPEAVGFKPSMEATKRNDAHHNAPHDLDELVSAPVPQGRLADVPNAEEEMATMDALPVLESVVERTGVAKPVAKKPSPPPIHPAQGASAAGNGNASVMAENDHHLSSIVTDPVTVSSKEVAKSRPLSASKVATSPRKVKQKALYNGFTVQLMGTQKAFRAKHFIETHHLHPGARYYRTQRNGADWYVVVYGSYPSRTAAKAAIKTLPPAVQAQKPWVRSNKSLPALPL